MPGSSSWRSSHSISTEHQAVLYFLSLIGSGLPGSSGLIRVCQPAKNHNCKHKLCAVAHVIANDSDLGEIYSNISAGHTSPHLSVQQAAVMSMFFIPVPTASACILCELCFGLKQFTQNNLVSITIRKSIRTSVDVININDEVSHAYLWKELIEASSFLS